MYCTELLPLQYSTVRVGSDNRDHDPQDRQPFRGLSGNRKWQSPPRALLSPKRGWQQ